MSGNGFSLAEYYLVHTNGFIQLIGVSSGKEGGFAFNIPSSKTGRNYKYANFQAFSNWLNSNVSRGARMFITDGHEMTPDDLLNFATHSLGREPTSGYQSIIKDKDGHSFGEYNPRLFGIIHRLVRHVTGE